jgi:hypothetical protein
MRSASDGVVKNPITGKASYNDELGLLTVMANRKDGPYTTIYMVKDEADTSSTPQVPQFKLIKLDIAVDGSAVSVKAAGDVYHIAVREFGAECSCAHAHFRTNGVYCKHLLSAKAVGLIPK